MKNKKGLLEFVKICKEYGLNKNEVVSAIISNHDKFEICLIDVVLCKVYNDYEEQDINEMIEEIKKINPL